MNKDDLRTLAMAVVRKLTKEHSRGPDSFAFTSDGERSCDEAEKAQVTIVHAEVGTLEVTFKVRPTKGGRQA